ncbi:unnamed protein product [Vitrella brassicaformis CCMP3155]|uniref:Letm1 RBD domain-containing protein n=1 Tax=Vitrella brassicaformis (strain CCMP3155) TaxID=1169540 RepID=A0A0G4FEM6_VITBC|nr:unnamed protein product [Vitrella brassicaformis CCMP3155]|eukprot:CEM11439.1 unnamed protein product [Vitrella brassicaformis CCMP3155]
MSSIIARSFTRQVGAAVLRRPGVLSRSLLRQACIPSSPSYAALVLVRHSSTSNQPQEPRNSSWLSRDVHWLPRTAEKEESWVLWWQTLRRYSLYSTTVPYGMTKAVYGPPVKTSQLSVVSAASWVKKQTAAAVKWTVDLGKVVWGMVLQVRRDPRVLIKWWHDIKKETIHWCKWVYTGFALFVANIRVSTQLVKKKLTGLPLSYREHKLLVRTTTDMFKLIPFSLFIIIPLGELALPFALRLFPNMLPSTFFEKQYDSAYLSRKLKAKQELANFFQEIVNERTKSILEAPDHSHRDKAGVLRGFQEKLITRDESESPFLSVKEVLQFAKLFKDEFNLEKMSAESLKVICRMLGIEPYGLQTHVVLQLRHHLLQLKREDREMMWEGVENLTHEELIEACKARAMRFYGISDDEMREQLREWFELSSHREIPPVLLLWARSITMTHMPQDISEPTQAAEPEGEAAEEVAAVSGLEMREASLQEAQSRLDELRREEKDLKDNLKQLRETVKEEARKRAAAEAESERSPEAAEAQQGKAPAEEAEKEERDHGLIGGEAHKVRMDRDALLRRATKMESELKLLRQITQMQQTQLCAAAASLASLVDRSVSQPPLPPLEGTFSHDTEHANMADQLTRVINSVETGLADIDKLLNSARNVRSSEDNTDPFFYPSDTEDDLDHPAAATLQAATATSPASAAAAAAGAAASSAVKMPAQASPLIMDQPPPSHEKLPDEIPMEDTSEPLVDDTGQDEGVGVGVETHKGAEARV